MLAPFPLIDERGSAAIEFALCAGVLILLLSAIIEFGVMFAVDASLQAAVMSASRFGVTGAEGEGMSRQAQILAIIDDRTLGLVDTGRMEISTRVYASFDQIGKPEPFVDANGNNTFDAGEAFTDVNGNGTWDADLGVAGLGGAGDVVVYSLSYPWTALTPLLAPFLNGTTLRAAVAVRNEPW
jgi:Flp pilus assembly protein TadG